MPALESADPSELSRTLRELRNLASSQEASREAERTVISREIHDLLGQDLTALKLDLAWMRQRIPPGHDELARKIESMSVLVDSTAKAVRRISRQLRPSMLDDLGLVEAVSLHLREFEESTGIVCVLLPPDRELPGNRAMATAFFRILQEALSNASRHAGATHIVVSIGCDDDTGTLSVSDDGRGVLPEQLRSEKAVGLIGIRERVLALGGTVSVNGRPGGGTTVEVKVPCINGEDSGC